MQHRFPDEFPREEIAVVINKLRGQPVPIAEASEAAWWVVGYGLGLGMPHDHLVGAAQPMDDAALAAKLEEASLSQGVAGAAAIPWTILLPLLMKLLERWLTKEGE